MSTRAFRQRPGFDDGIERCATGVFIRLSKNQVEALETLAQQTGKSLKDYLRDTIEAAAAQMLPAR